MRNQKQSLFVNHMTGIMCAIILLPLLSGCSMARIAVEDLPINVARNQSNQTDVPVYEYGIELPPRAGIPIARLGAHGNGYANKEYLLLQLGKRGSKIGADFIVAHNQQINAGPTVTSYGRYSAISSTIQTLSIYGTAYVFAPVRLGAQWDTENVIIDLQPGMPAKSAGLEIGDRILAVNGNRTTNDPLAAPRALAACKPGDRVRIEVETENGIQRQVLVRAAGNN